MVDVLQKCVVCGSWLDEEDLFCSNCGRSSTPASERLESDKQTISTHHFECQGCGASMSYDATAGTLRCPFCGSERLDRQKDQRVLRAHGVVPFQVDQTAAERLLRQWLGKGFWRPSDLARAARIARITRVYVPYWVFAAETHTYWTADTSQTPMGARSDWYPVTGEHRGQYSGLLVGASSTLVPDETTSLCPFDLSHQVDPSQVDLDAVIVEQFTVHRKYARPLAHQGLRRREEEACAAKYLPARHRNLRANVRFGHMHSEPVLLPVWIMAYRYRDKLFRFLINGQTGRTTGDAPVSSLKIAGAVLIGIVILVLVMIVIALSNVR